MLEIPLRPFGVNIWGLLGLSTLPERLHQRDPKRHFLHGKHVFSAIIDLCAAIRSGCARAKKGHTKTLYFAYVWGSSVQTIVIIFGTARYITDVIHLAKYCIDRFRGFGLGQGQSSGLP